MFNFDYTEVAPAIFVYENVIDNSQEIIDLAFKKAGWSAASIVERNELKGDPYISSDDSVRVVNKLDLPPTFNEDIRFFLLAKKFWEYGDHYADKHDTAFIGFETPQLLHYNTSKGFYKAHFDTIPGINRIFSAVLYLNDVEEGGETYFEKFDVSVSPKEGRLVIFPANFAYVHEAMQPVSNDKIAVVTWYSGAS